METSISTIEDVAVSLINSAEVMDVELLIIGGGPAGLSAGIYAERNGINTLVVDKGKLGGQVLDTTFVENYPGMKKVSGAALAEIMSAHAMDYVKIFEHETVLDIIPGSPFLVFTSKRVINTKAIIVATGARRRPLGIEEEHNYWGKGLSYSPTKEGHQFIGKKAFIVGGGDSAITEAIFLHDIGVEITVIHRSEKLDAQQALINQLIARKIPVLYQMEVNGIKGQEMLERVVLKNKTTRQTEEHRVDGLFVSIGYIPAFELAKKLGLTLANDGTIQHQSCRTSLPGLYVAGDISGGYKQIVTASSQGAEAALTVYQDFKNGLI